jgi:peptidoglycan/LPS O-acetylase OafA/YrhL
MLPGFYAYGLIFFALHPSFQISKKTSPLFLVAALASVANGVMVALFSRMTDTTLFGIVLSASLVTGLVLLAFAALRSQPILPRFRDIGATLLGTGCMAAAVLLLPAEHAGPQLLLAQAGLGAAVYAALAYALDLCGLRARLRFGTGQASG